MKTDPVVVLAGSRALPVGSAPRLLIRFLTNLPHGSTILLRHPKSGSVGDFEVDVMRMCSVVGLAYNWRVPQPTTRLRGRRAVWARDTEMLAEADVALCFYDVGQIGDEESGTVALVDKAIALDVPVYAYALTSDNEVIRVGEHDPKDLWAAMVPST